jgi:hypothetical protein
MIVLDLHDIYVLSEYTTSTRGCEVVGFKPGVSVPFEKEIGTKNAQKPRLRQIPQMFILTRATEPNTTMKGGHYAERH